MLHRVLASILVSLFAFAPLAVFAQDATPARVSGRDVGVVNLNTASQAELEALPGIGPKTAERILEYRQKNGSFKKIEDLMNVKGIGEKSFLKLKPLLVAQQKSDADAKK